MSKKKSDEIVIPTAAEVPTLTDRLVEIEKEIKTLTAEKKGIEARLEAFALQEPEEHQPLKDANREGRRVIMRGKGWSLPVVFSSDLLIKSFPNDGPKHRELNEILKSVALEGQPNPLKLFYDEPASWTARYDDGVKFRAAALEFLGKDLAPKFIAACRQTDKHGIAKSKTSFDFKAAEAVAEN